jgi:PAS domain S-box-containing protein
VQDYAIFLLDPTGHIRTWNKGVEKLKGYKPDEIIGKHFSTFYMKEDIDAKKPEKELEIAIQFGRAEDEDWRVRKDGSRFWASVVITALYDDEGTLVGFAKVTRDLTERKQHEDDLRRANVLLRAQQRDLEQLNQAKDEFISLASHQLRTPATAIKQLLGLFVEGFITDFDESHLEIIKKAFDSNERQISVVNKLLKVAQADSGKIVLRLEECVIKPFLQEVLAEFTETFNHQHQTVELSVSKPTLSVMADRSHLRMALENIISNASKYTHPHGTITVSARANKKFVMISVADNGVGIAPNDTENLFEKFRRIPNDLSEQVGGSGLGLYWANKVISLHGGRIEVESELNEGTTFTVCLPLEY